MAYRHLTIVREGPGGVVERVTLNRPEVRNALNDALIADLSEWAASIHEQRAQDRPRAALMAGAGPSFSAGADLAWMAKTVDYTREQNLEDAAALSRLFERLDTLPVPLIGRIHGAALGGGSGLAAVCDVAIADDETVFGFTEVRLGIVPAVISPFVLAKIGRSAARELFLTGARFPAARAREIGLVHRVVPSAALDEAVADCVQEVLAGGPQAVAVAKALIRQISTCPPDEAAALTAQTIAARRVSPEGQEGLRAFLDKRKPGWIG
jgi:methylglutaconyl-CoA hydratase